MLDINEKARELLYIAGAIARRLVRRLPYAHQDLDAVESDAAMGVWRGLLRFDPERGVPLKLYVWRMASYYAWNGLRDRRSLRDRPSDQERRAFLESRLELEETRRGGRGRPAETIALQRWERQKEIERAAMRIDDYLQAMPPDLRAWAEQHYLDNVSMTKIGEQEGLTRSAVSIRLIKCFRKLRARQDLN